MTRFIYVISGSFFLVFSFLFEEKPPVISESNFSVDPAVTNNLTEHFNASKDSTKKEIPFATIDKIPTTAKCSSLTKMEEVKTCVSNEFKEFVSANFNMNMAKKHGIKGINRIYTRFKIDTNGNITDIEAKGPHPKLEAEAKRVLSIFPKMTPGEHKGEKVKVLYSLPVVFQIENSSDKELNKVISSQIQVKDTIPLKETLSGYDTNTVQKGFYLITNIFKTEALFKKGIENLKQQNLQPKWFKNPKDSFTYVYLKRYDTLEEAKKMLLSEFDGKYKKELYILNID